MDVMILYLEWMEQAACRGTDDPVFFAPDGPDGPPTGAELGQIRSETSKRDVTAKIRYCAVCPVRLKCAGLGWTQEYGTFGGWSPGERRMHDDGRYLPTKVRSVVSPSRDEAVRLVRDEGLSPEDAATKMEMNVNSVVDYLRQAWTLATQSDIDPTA